MISEQFGLWTVRIIPTGCRDKSPLVEERQHQHGHCHDDDLGRATHQRGTPGAKSGDEAAADAKRVTPSREHMV
jgi:hypothetical protein